MFGVVVVLLSVVFLVVDARVFSRRQDADYESEQLDILQRDGSDDSDDDLLPCYTALQQCHVKLAMQYMHVIQAIESDKAEHPGDQMEEVILRGIRNAITPGSISARHCPHIQAWAECGKQAIENSCGSEHQVTQFLPQINEGIAILHDVCQPENARIIEANMPCITDLAMIQSLGSCGDEVNSRFENFDTSAASCSSFKAQVKSAGQQCLVQRVESASVCSSARSNGGISLFESISGRVIDIGLELAEDDLCESSADAPSNLMSLQKKFFEDVYNFRF